MKAQEVITQTESLSFDLQPKLCRASSCHTMLGSPKHGRRKKYFDEFDYHPPGRAAEPQLHKGYETAIYLLKGRVDTRYGEQLEKSVICEEGDFIYMKADVPHRPLNLSATEPALALVA